MTLKRWMLVIGGMGLIGMVRVAQHTALWLKAYEVGQRATRVHALENHTQWLSAEVAGAQAPLRLARVARERKLKLVAWSAMPVPVSLVGRASVPAPMMMAGTASVAGAPKPLRLARESDGAND
jgi:hypothetical protein